MPRASDRAIRLGTDDEEVWELPVTCCSSSVQRALTPRASDRTIRLGAYDEEDWELNMSVAGESANGKATQPIQSIVTSASKGMQMASRATQHAVREQQQRQDADGIARSKTCRAREQQR